MTISEIYSAEYAFKTHEVAPSVAICSQAMTILEVIIAIALPAIVNLRTSIHQQLDDRLTRHSPHRQYDILQPHKRQCSTPLSYHC